MKPLALLCLVFASFSYAQVNINFTNPTLLVDQVYGFDLAQTPKLNSQEQQLVPMLQEQLAAKSYLALYQQLNKEVSKDDRSPAMSHFLGQLSLQLNQPKQALTHFDMAIKQQANYAKAIAGAGLAALQLKQFSRANDYFSDALKLGVKDPQLYRYMGFSYLEQEQYMSAVIALEQAKLLLPNDEQLEQALIYGYTNSGQSEAALAMLEQVLSKDASNAKLWLQRANIYLAKQDYDVTISSLETAIRLGEQDSANLALTAQLQLQYGSTPRAIHLYQTMWSKREQLQSVLDAINYLIDTNKDSEADGLLAKVTKANNKANSKVNAEVHYLSGKLALQKQSWQQAKRSLLNALKLNPIHPHALLTLARVYKANNDTHQAQMMLLRAAELPEVQLQALTEHADLELNLGNTRKALVLLRQALALKPNEQTLINNVNTLQQMVLQQGS